MAGTAVFSTYELLEGILKNVDILDLLTARRVAKDWHDVIEQSLLLRQKLFLAPVSSEYLLPDKALTTNARHNNVLFMNPQPFAILPLFNQHQEHYPRFARIVSGPGWLEGRTMCICFWLLADMRRAAESTLWRHAFLTQPPCTALGVEITTTEYGSKLFYIDAAIQDEDGITLGLIVDTFERMLRSLKGDKHSSSCHVYLTSEQGPCR